MKDKQLLEYGSMVNRSLVFWAREMQKIFRDIRNIKKHPTKNTFIKISILKKRLELLVRRGEMEVSNISKWEKSYKSKE